MSACTLLDINKTMDVTPKQTKSVFRQSKVEVRFNGKIMSTECTPNKDLIYPCNFSSHEPNMNKNIVDQERCQCGFSFPTRFFVFPMNLGPLTKETVSNYLCNLLDISNI